MKTLVIYTHPSPDSFNAAIKDRVVQTLEELGSEVCVRDLYAIGFDPVMTAKDVAADAAGTSGAADVVAEQEHVLWADHLVFVYPIWWVDRPAMLKGYIDRVFLHGFAFRYTAEGLDGLLKPRTALVFQTAGNPHEHYVQTGQERGLWAAMGLGTLEFCGLTNVRMETFHLIGRVDETVRAQMLDRTGELVRELTG